jgi:hypothetical protein
MVFLASHVLCSPMSSLQYFLLLILNDGSIENPQAIKLKVQSLEPLLVRCKDASFTTALLNQEKQIDPTDFRKELVQIVGIGANAAQISLLLDLVRGHGPLASCACQQLAVVFPAASHAPQLQIAKLLINQIESGPSVFPQWISLTAGSGKSSIVHTRFDPSSNFYNSVDLG